MRVALGVYIIADGLPMGTRVSISNPVTEVTLTETGVWNWTKFNFEFRLSL